MKGKEEKGGKVDGVKKRGRGGEGSEETGGFYRKSVP